MIGHGAPLATLAPIINERDPREAFPGVFRDRRQMFERAAFSARARPGPMGPGSRVSAPKGLCHLLAPELRAPTGSV